MKRYGYDVLKNGSAWKRWLRVEGMSPDYEEAPTHFPCIAESLLGSDANPYPTYIYIETVEIMREALSL